MRFPVLLISSFGFLVVAQDVAPSKRGLCYVSSRHSSTDDAFWNDPNNDLTWYYNYESKPTSGINNTKLQFVPMLWGAPKDTSDMSFYNDVKGLMAGGMKIPYVLAFNEPDGCLHGGSCVDAQTAAETWIRQLEPLRQQGVKLGAPAVTSAPTGFNWLQNFFTECAGRCTADFIPIHYYGDFEGFASHIGQVNATYMNATMWVTEWNLPFASLNDTENFYKGSVDYLDKLRYGPKKPIVGEVRIDSVLDSYITHYSIFGAFRSDISNVGTNATLLTQRGQLTDMGAWYLGEPQLAVGNIPSSQSTGSNIAFPMMATLLACICAVAALTNI